MIIDDGDVIDTTVLNSSNIGWKGGFIYIETITLDENVFVIYPNGHKHVFGLKFIKKILEENRIRLIKSPKDKAKHILINLQ